MIADKENELYAARAEEHTLRANRVPSMGEPHR